MKVAIITEGFQGTGYGHLTRGLSIYQAFEEKRIQPLFIANCDEEGKMFIPNVNLLQLNWIKNTDKLIEQIKDFDIAVIDSYLAPLEIYKKIYKTVKKVVYIDDYLRLDYPPGVIINGTIGAENLPYEKVDNHQYLLGIDYIPLRKEFWDVEISKKIRPIKNVLVTFGAQDFRNLTPTVLFHLLRKFPRFNYNVVVGNNYKEENNIENIHYYNTLNAKEMLNLMLSSDLAITAAGQTTYELARVGLSSIAIGIADNQANNIKGWLSAGFIRKEIWYTEKDLMNIISIELNELLTNNVVFSNLLDGQGARKICSQLIN